MFLGASSLQTCAQIPPKLPASTAVLFELRSGFLIVVHGQIGTIDGLRFILDTGATRSVIDAKLAKKLGLADQLNGATHSFDEVIPAKVIRLSDITIGPLHVPSLPALSMKLAEVSSPDDADSVTSSGDPHHRQAALSCLKFNG